MLTDFEGDVFPLNSTIKPGTRTAHLLNVNQNDQRVKKREKQVCVQLTQYLLWDFHIFVALTREIHIFLNNLKE